MKKEEYLRQVKRALRVPARRKREVLRDLEEAFDSAREQGEDEAALAERLGSPAAFAAGVNRESRPGPAARLAPALLGLAALLVLGLAWFSHSAALSARLPENAIGGAVGSTSIQVEGAVDPFPLLLALGAALLAAAVFLFLRLRRGRGKP